MNVTRIPLSDCEAKKIDDLKFKNVNGSLIECPEIYHEIKDLLGSVCGRGSRAVARGMPMP
ncbi:MAG: hypothetical protein KZQ57_12075 [gamma proteobacterium symbiont of Lucinoma myriamae]|nr:hypothetical protein [gamma proteobacterium symbiont of Lucinoma myriamae]